MTRYVLFLYDAPDETAISAAEMAARVTEYRNWAIGLRKAGSDITGEKLAPESLDLGAAAALPRAASARRATSCSRRRTRRPRSRLRGPARTARAGPRRPSRASGLRPFGAVESWAPESAVPSACDLAALTPREADPFFPRVLNLDQLGHPAVGCLADELEAVVVVVGDDQLGLDREGFSAHGVPDRGPAPDRLAGRVGGAGQPDHPRARGVHPGRDVLLLDVVVAHVPDPGEGLAHHGSLELLLDVAPAEDPAVDRGADGILRGLGRVQPGPDLRVEGADDRIQLLVRLAGRRGLLPGLHPGLVVGRGRLLARFLRRERGRDGERERGDDDSRQRTGHPRSSSVGMRWDSTPVRYRFGG